MVKDKGEIRRAAQIFVERFGEDAPAQASRRVRELRSAGKPHSSAKWQAIYEAINTLIGDASDGH